MYQKFYKVIDIKYHCHDIGGEHVRVKILCVLMALLVFAGCAQLTADEIVKKMEEKYNSIKDMKADIITKIIAGNNVTTSKYMYWLKNEENGTKFRIENDEFLSVSNGSVLIMYNKKDNSVTMLNVSGMNNDFDYGKVIRQMLENYSIKFLGEENVNGIDCYVVNATPKENEENKGLAGEPMFIKMWVDKKYWYPIKTEVRIGDVETISEYRNVSFNTGLNDSIFEFTPPKNAKILKSGDFNFVIERYSSIDQVKERVNFTLYVPSYTAGCEFINATVVDDKAATLMYMGDNCSFWISEEIPLFPMRKIPGSERVSVMGVNGTYAEFLGLKSVRFRYDNIRIEVSSKDLGKEELIAIANSMKPLS